MHVRAAAARERGAGRHPERVRPRQLEQATRRPPAQARPARRARAAAHPAPGTPAGRRSRCSRRSRARRRRPRRPRPCTSRRRRRSGGSRPRSRSQRPSRAPARPGRRRSGRACSRTASACGGRTARAPPRSRARSRQSASSSPAPGSGGRISAAIAKPPGRRAWSDGERVPAPSSSGRSTWQETTAYRFARRRAMCGICGLLAAAGAPDPALVERMNAALVHRGPDEGSVDAFGRCVLGHRRLR